MNQTQESNRSLKKSCSYKQKLFSQNFQEHSRFNSKLSVNIRRQYLCNKINEIKRVI